MGRLRGVLGGIIGAGGAVVSSLCCVLPLAIVLLGLGSGAFMATTMKYTPVFIPIGIASVAAGFCLYFRERRRCAAERCKMIGGTFNLALLTLSALAVGAAVFFTLFPQLSSDFLVWTTSGPAKATPHSMDMSTGSPR